ncbi:arcA, partial [Symbiodinium sp. CCMP2456]
MIADRSARTRKVVGLARQLPPPPHHHRPGVKVFEDLADDPEVTIEGGDVLVADRETVLVGVSQRTNEKGAEKLAQFLFSQTPVKRVVK